jgi:LysR family hydrogen peroxide-inducible transcriptional activator
MPASALPSLRQLRYLVELARTLNFRQAAEACFVTQSTLSAGIKELESVLGVDLVERDKRNVRLTAAGEQIVERARNLLASAQDLVQVARGAAQPLSGPLHLGAIPTIAPFLLPGLLALLRARFPSLKLYLREDLTERLLERLRAGQLDVALIALPFETGELLVRKLFKDEFWYVAREDDPLAKGKEVAVRQLDPGRILLLEEGHCLRDHAIAACGPRAPRGEAVVEATSLHTLIQMVDSGLGVTLLPEMTLKAGILKGTDLVARPFSTQVPARTVVLASRPTSARRGDLDLLAEVVSEHMRRAQPAGLPSYRRRPRPTGR